MKYIITATPVAEIDFDGYYFYVASGETVDVEDFCFYLGVSASDVFGISTINIDIQEQYKFGQLLILDIVENNEADE